MQTDITPNLKLPYILAAQAQKHVTHNDAIRALDAITQLSVIDRDLSEPPVQSDEGARYIIPAPASGVWAGHDGEIAAYQDGAWMFYPPKPGWLCWIEDESALITWDGSAWVAAGSSGNASPQLLGVNTAADSTNRLAVKSDAVLFSHDDITPGNGDIQTKLNKASSTDTASFIFQTNWSGRAEIGLTGDDDFHFKVSADGSNWIEAITIDKATGEVNFPQNSNTGTDLPPITATLPDNAVDIFIYDTSKDSDGGAWRRRCQNTSWYNEALNTATRGSRREFPAMAVIVAEANKITIYDGDDPALPMWMVFERGGAFNNGTARLFGASGDINTCTCLNGVLAVGKAGSPWDTLTIVNFAADDSYYHRSNGRSVSQQNIALRNSQHRSAVVWQSGIDGIVNNAINAIAMAVFPDTTIDPATGLQVPVIAVATEGGVSVIREGDSVVDFSSPTTPKSNFVNFNRQHQMFFGADAGDEAKWIQLFDDFSANKIYSYPARPNNIYNTAKNISGTRQVLLASQANVAAIISDNDRIFVGTSKGLGLGTINADVDNLVVHMTGDHISGWLPGDIKGAWLADTDTSNLTNGSADADRSIAGHDLTVTGTIARSSVAAGAELISYSGFSASNTLTLTDASMSDTLYALCWVEDNGVWQFEHGVVSTGAIDGVSISGTTLTVGGSKPKALLRLTATTPSAAQLAKIEADERAIFQPNAACTFYGASDAVTALAHDIDTDLLHVGTSAGRSVFDGLRRIDNNTTPVTTAISATGGMIAEQ